MMSFTLCFMQSCSTEEAALEGEATIKTVGKEEAILFLKSQNSLPSNTSKTTNFTFEFEKITQEKTSHKEALITVIPVRSDRKSKKTRVILWKVDNTIETIIYNEYANESSTITSFTGIIIMTRLNGDFVRAYKLKNNDYVIDLVPIKKDATSKSSNSLDEEAIGLQEVIVINDFKKTSYTFVPMIDGSNKTVSDLEDYYWLKSGGGGASSEPVVEEEIINELTGKAKCLNDLLDKNGDSFVKNLLANFEGESEFNIQIVSKDNVFSTETGLEINGKTLPPKNNVIVIEISTSRTNLNSSLDGARTILHEYIHADIFRKLNTTTGTTEERLDFKNTYEAYGNQHGTIAGLYLNSMKEALKGFHKTALIDDYNKYINNYGEAPSDAFYEALAWSGLRENNVKAWADLPAEKKSAIEALANRVDGFSRTVPCP
jgi:hypothetical protein